MNDFKQFTFEKPDLIFGGDLIVTWAQDIYDTDRDRIIYFPGA